MRLTERMTRFNEAHLVLAALERLRQLGTRQFGPNLASSGAAPARAAFEQLYRYDRLRIAARRIKPGNPELVDEPIARLERAESQNRLAEKPDFTSCSSPPRTAHPEHRSDQPLNVDG